jgi:UDP-2,3-diacylglucosamine pyrophosphatase LpxH
MKKYRAIFISDVHLGTKTCMAKDLLDFLKNNDADVIYLVGDIIDGWKIAQNRWRWNKTQSQVVQQLIKLIHRSKVIYIPGNHDEFLRPLLKQKITFKGFELHNQYVHHGRDGKKYLVTHGDLFDGITRLTPWISYLGDRAYDIALALNYYFNLIRHHLGFGYWSLSAFLKQRVKKAVNFIFKFETAITDYSKRKGYDGVICGHIHHAEIKQINGVTYMNDGDWVESATALVEHHDGRFEIVTWNKTK